MRAPGLTFRSSGGGTYASQLPRESHQRDHSGPEIVSRHIGDFLCHLSAFFPKLKITQRP